ncbi:MAG: class I SAM-dependent methyltransferase [Candidatus Korobacteraceae bacterium]
MIQVSEKYYKRDFWADENRKYLQPHFRLEKAARLINRIANGKECDLLDVGCGPATLMHLLDPNIHYYGIDIAIQEPSPNLIEADFVETPIKFHDKQFDIIVVQGVFEYIGNVQRQKLSEICDLLNQGGTFIATYVNFEHRNKNIYWPYNNIQSFSVFHRSLTQFFHVDRYFPSSHRWYHDEPRGRLMWTVQKHINLNIPLLSRLFGVEYFFICSKKQS